MKKSQMQMLTKLIDILIKVSHIVPQYRIVIVRYGSLYKALYCIDMPVLSSSTVVRFAGEYSTRFYG